MFRESTAVRVRIVLECEGVMKEDADGIVMLETEDKSLVVVGQPGCYEIHQFIDTETRDQLWDDLRRVRGIIAEFRVVPMEVK